MSYMNQQYPASNRIYSRPYRFNFSVASNPTLGGQYNQFRSALHDMGEDLLEGNDIYGESCDLDALPPKRGLHTPFWHERTIAESEHAAELMALDLPAPEKKALNDIIEQVKASRIMIPTGRRANEVMRETPYDMPKLIEDFKTLWAYDPMIDPRLSYAEDLFNTHRDLFPIEVSTFGRTPGDDIKEERMVASLNWMAQDENAQRIALMFLHSRLSQHFGEGVNTSFLLARHVAEELDNGNAAGVVSELELNPAYYLNQAASPHTGGLPIISGLAKTQASRLKDAFGNIPHKVYTMMPRSNAETKKNEISMIDAFVLTAISLSNDPELRQQVLRKILDERFHKDTNAPKAPQPRDRHNNRNQGDLINVRALAASAEQMVTDYQALRDGSWARTHADMLREKQAGFDYKIEMGL